LANGVVPSPVVTPVATIPFGKVVDAQTPTMTVSLGKEAQPLALTRSASRVSIQQIKDSWPEILEAVEKTSRASWMVVFTARPVDLRPDDVLVLNVASQGDLEALRQRSASGDGIGDHLKQAVFDVLGFRPLLLPHAEILKTTLVGGATVNAKAAQGISVSRDEPPLQQEAPEPTEPFVEPAISWVTAVITDAEPETKPVVNVKPAVARKTPVRVTEPEAKQRPAPVSTVDGKQRYGESVVREILGAHFIEEQAVAPRVAPREQ